ncbi:hypothetical protein BWD08_07575 [Neisseria animaloris]|nr:hypothetical protein BWD08_07575 [Neisseria animaloris]
MKRRRKICFFRKFIIYSSNGFSQIPQNRIKTTAAARFKIHPHLPTQIDITKSRYSFYIVVIYRQIWMFLLIKFDATVKILFLSGGTIFV